jgi:hypothetical protein
MVERPRKDLSVRRQCALLNLARSGVYRPKPVIGADDLALMRRIDELHLELPFYGSRRMMFELNKEDRGVNRKRVQRLMRVMGTSAAFTGKLEAARIAISMDGRGRFMDNIFIERLWRSIKYEEVVCCERNRSGFERVRCFAEDEGRSLEVGLQEQASNRHELHWSRADVVNVDGKGGAGLRQVRFKETNGSKPLMTPVSMPDGTLVGREKGTPQGAVVSPILANLFLHYAFDHWMKENNPDIPFERYADDAICHCRSEAQALSLRRALEARLAACKLELHPQKTKIVYCKDSNRPNNHSERRFDFLGFTFRPRQSMNRAGKLFVSFSPAISDKAAKAMREVVRGWRLHHRNDLALGNIAQWARPILVGWVNYYGRFHRSALRGALRTVDSFIVRWAQRKYKRLRGRAKRAWGWLRGVKSRQPDLFAHWFSGSPVGAIGAG